MKRLKLDAFVLCIGLFIRTLLVYIQRQLWLYSLFKGDRVAFSDFHRIHMVLVLGTDSNMKEDSYFLIL